MPKKLPKSRQTSDPMAIDTINQLKALANPLRMQLLEQFAIKPTTTKQVAVALGLQPTRLYHHVAKLENAGLIKLVNTKRIRGTTEKYFLAEATSLKVDRSAFPKGSAELVGNLLEAGVVENFLGVVRSEVSEYLAQRDDDEDIGAESRIQDEAMFAGTELDVADSDVETCRDKINQLLAELGEISEAAGKTNAKRQKYRLMLGWYPRV